MDKYEFNIKVEQIKKLVNKGDYEPAKSPMESTGDVSVAPVC